jgi:hypothetical protein
VIVFPFKVSAIAGLLIWWGPYREQPFDDELHSRSGTKPPGPGFVAVPLPDGLEAIFPSPG